MCNVAGLKMKCETIFIYINKNEILFVGKARHLRRAGSNWQIFLYVPTIRFLSKEKLKKVPGKLKSFGKDFFYDGLNNVCRVS